jgi:hypothetical protein
VNKRVATQENYARLTTTTPVDPEPPMGGRHDVEQAGGGPQAEEWHGLAVEVLMIDRRRKNRYGGLSMRYFRIQHLYERRLDLCARPTPPLAST